MIQIMDKNAVKILLRLNKLRVGVFIDDANLFYTQKRLGWKISWLRYKKLIDQYSKSSDFYYYIGNPPTEKNRKETKKIVQKLIKIGYKVKTKPLKKIFVSREKFIYKCNFDVEMALDVSEKIDRLDMVIISSGDGDFLAIKNLCLKKGKKFMVICFEKNIAWELKLVHHLYFENIRTLVQK
ncbi:hypothetical protein COS80_00810 [Candidatus Woesebacteria bacterium CG06_land_8_20_14_3_00_39_27]|uniref:NYN domain-containing protein n=1 Tax=Candidatus Woesebacteria bacterium CG06_land_8_20_14_3_00_39_27 TaxID=1975057 RepID=A0A2M7AQH1_9BACT|nr:MAG: hypothetical protein COS80_00810 [Candidatus Woesebacteria bacterium CG06_land_8_20_14_3_00_39_27]